MKRAIFFVMLLLLLIGALFYSGGALLQIISSFNFSSLYTNSGVTPANSQAEVYKHNRSMTAPPAADFEKIDSGAALETKNKISAEANPTSSGSAGNTPQLSTDSVRKLKILDEVFSSKDDNDVRLDSEFKNMTPELKGALRDRFTQTASEQLNQRGTFLFLLGREINSREDVEFLSRVVAEPVCLSVENCNRSNPNQQSSAALLAYPQMVSLIGFQRALEQRNIEPALREQIIQNISAVAANNVEPMATLAKEILNQQNIQ